MAATEAHAMTDAQVAATLHQAVRTGVLVDWTPVADGTWWIVIPQVGLADAKTDGDVREYCRKLNRDGVTP